MAEDIDFDTAYQLLMGDEPPHVTGSQPSTPAPLTSFAQLATFNDQVTTPQRYHFDDHKIDINSGGSGGFFSPLGHNINADFLFQSPNQIHHHHHQQQQQLFELPHLNELTNNITTGLTPPPFSPGMLSPDLNMKFHNFQAIDLLSNTETNAIESFLDSIVIKKDDKKDGNQNVNSNVNIINIIEKETGTRTETETGTDKETKREKQQFHIQNEKIKLEITTTPQITDHSTAIGLGVVKEVAPSGSGSGSGKMKKKILGVDQKKRNHLVSEQRRRDQIKESFERLVGLLDHSHINFALLEAQQRESEEPAKKKRKRKSNNSEGVKVNKAVILSRAIWEIKTLQEINNDLEVKLKLKLDSK